MKTTLHRLNIVREHITNTLSVEDSFDRGFYLGRATAVLSDLIREGEEKELTESQQADQALKRVEDEADGHVVGPGLLFATAAVQSWFSEFHGKHPAPIVLPGLCGAHDQFGGKYHTMTSGGVKSEGESFSEGAWYPDAKRAIAALKYEAQKHALQLVTKVIFVRGEPHIVRGDPDGPNNHSVAAVIRLSFSHKSISEWAQTLEQNPINPEFFEA